MAATASGTSSGQSTPSRIVAAGDTVVSSEPWVWSFTYNTHKILCAYCFTEVASLRTCSSCKLYRCCSTECQSLSWNAEHRSECKMLKKIRKKLLPFEEAGAFDHDCEMKSCCLFGCCAAEILVAKIFNKITRLSEERPGGQSVRIQRKRRGPASLKYPPSPANLSGSNQRFAFFNRQICDAIWPPGVRDSIPHFEEMVKKLLYNIFPVLNQRGKFKPHIMGIFPQALQRTMTPVCLDNNVTINLQGRTLVVRAVKEVHYTGMKDLRQNEETRTSYVVKLKQRRRDFQIFYGYQCHCGKCTTEYEADINPLKCGTTGCPARIPSDARALQPCPLCGADNAAQLHKMHAAVRTQDRDKNKDRDNGIKETMKILTQVGELDTIVHPDAHIRFACGKDAVSYLQLLGCYEAAWELAQGMVDCVRALCPEYHVGRACFLVKAATIPYLWKRDISEQEQQRLATVFREALPKALGWMREAVSIYRKLNGEDSVWAQAVVDFMRIHAPADVSATESAALTPPARKANWDWGNQKAVVL